MVTFRQVHNMREAVAGAWDRASELLMLAPKDERLKHAVMRLGGAWADLDDLWQDLRPAPPGERIPDASPTT